MSAYDGCHVPCDDRAEPINPLTTPAFGGDSGARLPVPSPRYHWQAHLPFFYGWVIVGVALIMGFTFAAQNWAIGVFVLPMEEELGWPRSFIYGALTLRGLLAAFIAPAVGGYLDMRHGARIISLAGGLICSVSLALTAFVTTEWQFILLFGVFGGIATVGGGLLIIQAIVPKWFLRKRGTVMAYATMGSAIAAFSVPPLVNFWIEGFGWRGAWLAMGAMTLLLGGLPALLLRRQPEDVGLLPDGDAPHLHEDGSPRRVEDVSWTSRDATRSWTMWVLVFGISIGSLSIGGLPSNLVPLFVEKGFPREVAVLGFSAYGLFSIAARFFWGPVANRFHVRSVLIVIACYCALIMPVGIIVTGNVTFIFSALVGFGIGGYVAFHQLVWAAYFGRANLGAIGGIARPFSAIVNAAGPFTFALLYDQTRSYDVGLLVAMVSWVLCAGALLIARPRPHTHTVRS
ncbi:MAG: MFS transporter [Chloroflexota bacterium]